MSQPALRNPERKTFPIDELVPYPHNPKEHNEKQIAHIANSIERFGFVQPIVVDEDTTILIGHGRYLAAKKLQHTAIDVYQVTGYTDEEKSALRIVDNKLNMDTGFDVENLTFELEKLLEIDFEMGDFGLDFDMDALFGAQNSTREQDVDTTGTQKLVTYQNTSVRQIVLIFDAATFEKVLRDINEILQLHNLESNTDVFLFLLESLKNANSRSSTEVA